jgi:hypothetical protein
VPDATWIELRDHAGHLWGRLDPHSLHLELARSRRMAVFDLAATCDRGMPVPLATLDGSAGPVEFVRVNPPDDEPAAVDGGPPFRVALLGGSVTPPMAPAA